MLNTERLGKLSLKMFRRKKKVSLIYFALNHCLEQCNLSSSIKLCHHPSYGAILFLRFLLRLLQKITLPLRSQGGQWRDSNPAPCAAQNNINNNNKNNKLQSLVLQAFVLQVFGLAVCFAEIFKKKFN